MLNLPITKRPRSSVCSCLCIQTQLLIFLDLILCLFVNLCNQSTWITRNFSKLCRFCMKNGTTYSSSMYVTYIFKLMLHPFFVGWVYKLFFFVGKLGGIATFYFCFLEPWTQLFIFKHLDLQIATCLNPVYISLIIGMFLLIDKAFRNILVE